MTFVETCFDKIEIFNYYFCHSKKPEIFILTWKQIKRRIKFLHKTKDTAPLKQNISRLFFPFCSAHSPKKLEGNADS